MWRDIIGDGHVAPGLHTSRHVAAQACEVADELAIYAAEVEETDRGEWMSNWSDVHWMTSWQHGPALQSSIYICKYAYYISVHSIRRVVSSTHARQLLNLELTDRLGSLTHIITSIIHPLRYTASGTPEMSMGLGRPAGQAGRAGSRFLWITAGQAENSRNYYFLSIFTELILFLK